MIAFHGKQEIKELYLARVRAHRAANEIVKGKYWEKGRDGVFRGCAVGCTLHSGNHAEYESELGIPMALALIEDGIFEGLGEESHLAWPEEFLAAIPVGADLSGVADRFVLWLLEDTRQYCELISIVDYDIVIALYRRRIAGDEPSKKEWKAASAYYDDYDDYDDYEDYGYDDPTAAASYVAARYANAVSTTAARYKQSRKMLELMANAGVVG